MKTKVILIVLMLLGGVAQGQSVDKNRMDRDLEVATNVLESLLGNGRGLFWSRDVEASYVEDFGVIFGIPQRWGYGGGFGSTVVFPSDQSDNSSIVIAPSVQTIDKEDEDGGKEEFKNNLYTFLIDYASLIGQLKPSDRVVIKSNQGRGNFSYAISGQLASTERSTQKSFSAEISKKDIDEYKSGKINFEQAKSRVKYTETEPAKAPRDLVLFATIIQGLYRSDITETFFVSRPPTHEQLEGFGVIYYLDTYSSYTERDFYSMPALDQKNLTKDERNAAVMELLPKFIEDFKEVLIEYGRTIRSLGENETLMVKAKTTRCEGCEIPETLEFSVSKKTLSDFDQGRITLSEAVKQVKLEEVFK